MKAVVIGAGLIGKERINAIQRLEKEGLNISLEGVYDAYIDVKGVNQFHNFKDVYNSDADWMFIATPHNDAVDYAKEFLSKGYNVFIEKPLGRTLKEAQDIISCRKPGKNLYIGFNYRFYKGIKHLLYDIKTKRFGDIISVNMTLGHGCHPDIKNGWKLDPIRSGGGCLLDPGIHLIDLCRIIAKDKLDFVSVNTWNGFWKTGIEEECHLIMKSKKTIFNINISIVKWRSTFRIEVNGTDGYGIVDGRGKSYGVQKYTVGRRWGWLQHNSQKDSETLVISDDGKNVFYDEIDSVVRGINNVCDYKEALRNMKIYQKINDYTHL